MSPRWSFFSLVALGACGGSQTQIAIAPAPAPTTIATLVGPLCENGQTCTCRDPSAPGDGGAGTAPEGLKRFEIKVGPASNALWITLDDMVLYKSEQRADECFYVDLRPGPHRLGLRGHQDHGLSAAMTVREYGPAAQSWYDSVHFECGSPGVCSLDELATVKTEFAQVERGVHDKCGSVKVKGVSWDTGTAPDAMHPEDLAVSMTLQVYKFLPDKRHGDAACETHGD
ncbi:MAG: hypothetical protein K8W52_17785 [Deltaproteobacteria bacterium]|nr:hypothetical protein [Deltaproteobacteria bacterium]